MRYLFSAFIFYVVGARQCTRQNADVTTKLAAGEESGSRLQVGLLANSVVSTGNPFDLGCSMDPVCSNSSPNQPPLPPRSLWSRMPNELIVRVARYAQQEDDHATEKDLFAVYSHWSSRQRRRLWQEPELVGESPTGAVLTPRAVNRRTRHLIDDAFPRLVHNIAARSYFSSILKKSPTAPPTQSTQPPVASRGSRLSAADLLHLALTGRPSTMSQRWMALTMAHPDEVVRLVGGGAALSCGIRNANPWRPFFSEYFLKKNSYDNLFSFWLPHFRQAKALRLSMNSSRHNHHILAQHMPAGCKLLQLDCESFSPVENSERTLFDALPSGINRLELHNCEKSSPRDWRQLLLCLPANLRWLTAEGFGVDDDTGAHLDGMEDQDAPAFACVANQLLGLRLTLYAMAPAVFFWLMTAQQRLRVLSLDVSGEPRFDACDALMAPNLKTIESTLIAGPVNLDLVRSDWLAQLCTHNTRLQLGDLTLEREEIPDPPPLGSNPYRLRTLTLDPVYFENDASKAAIANFCSSICCELKIRP